MRRLWAVLMLGVLCTGLSACVSKKQYLARETDLTQQLDQESAKLNETRSQLQEAEKGRDQYQAELTTLQSQYETLQRQHDELSDKLNQVSQKTEELQTDLEARESVLALQRKIERDLKEQIANQEVKIEEIEGKLKVTFVDKILFSTGSATINEKGQQTLLRVTESLREQTDRSILVEGHTDNVPIGIGLQNRFPTNWELSTARATSIVRFLQDAGDLEPERLSACGYSYYRPVASNDSEEERSQNRRIEIILVPIK
ncbi:MAG: OmpA family protein [Candidatus Tectomicrobia bacterium]|nr:OmpA family protein [Candidatus Tectomicrobia bacterium]